MPRSQGLGLSPGQARSRPSHLPAEMLFVAMSCLQGRPMAGAFDELAALGAGLQLTPGNLERLRAGTPVVLECYMHRLSDAERRRQVELARGGDA